MTVRLSVNINDDCASVLKSRAQRDGTSVTEQLRRMVSITKYLDDQIAGGNELQLVRPDGSVTRVVVLP